MRKSLSTLSTELSPSVGALLLKERVKKKKEKPMASSNSTTRGVCRGWVDKFRMCLDDEFCLDRRWPPGFCRCLVAGLVWDMATP